MKRSAPILFGVVFLVASSALAVDQPTCSISSNGGNLGPPSGQVMVRIISMNTNGDMEPDFPFYDNKSDIFGKVTITVNGVAQGFDLPEMEGVDDPVWTSGNIFVTDAAALPGQPVHVKIHLEENDPGVLGGNDNVDVSPDPAHDNLEFDLNTCAMTLSGDINGHAGIIHVPSSGTAENQGVLVFEVDMADHRALSTKGDVVLQGFDMLQVLPGVTRMAAEKPTVGLVTVTNNTPTWQPVSVRLRVRDETNALIHDSTQSLGSPLAVGEVRSVYLAENDPVIPPDYFCKQSRLFAQADLILQPGAEDPGSPRTDCWIINNTSGVKQFEVATTKGPSLLWIRTGHLLSATSLATMSQLNAMHDGAMPFIRGVYPARSIDDTVSSFPLVPPLSGGLFSFVASLLAGIGIPADAATPYVMVLELNAAAALSGNDRLMGVLPKDWFNATLYGLLEGVTGLSLGELAPRAVIFESVTTKDGSVGPKLTLPAHELGHTYGLSLDPDIKNWWCNLTIGLGIIACGATGGFDEYNSDDHSAGVPTWGYWFPQDPTFVTGAEGEQCDATCMMGNTPINPYDDWKSHRKLIDGLDYDQLLDKLTSCRAAAPTALYVSGVIDAKDNMQIAHLFVQPTAPRLTDLADKPGEYQTVYAVRSVDANGRVLSEAELPLEWKQPEGKVAMQATFFGGYVPYVAGTAKIQFWNRDSKKLVGERAVSKAAPKLGTPSVKVSGSGKDRVMDIAWTATDGDKDAMTHFVQVSPDKGVHWWPVAHGLKSPKFTASLADIGKGTYIVRVLSSDGVNVATAQTSVSL